MGFFKQLCCWIHCDEFEATAKKYQVPKFIILISTGCRRLARATRLVIDPVSSASLSTSLISVFKFIKRVVVILPRLMSWRSCQSMWDSWDVSMIMRVSWISFLISSFIFFLLYSIFCNNKWRILFFTVKWVPWCFSCWVLAIFQYEKKQIILILSTFVWCLFYWEFGIKFIK